MQNLILGAIIFLITIFIIEWIIYQYTPSTMLIILINITGWYQLCKYICLLITIPGSKWLYQYNDILELNNEIIFRTQQCLSWINNFTQYKTNVERIKQAIQYLQIQCQCMKQLQNKNTLQQEYYLLLKRMCDYINLIQQSQTNDQQNIIGLDKINADQKQLLQLYIKELQKFLDTKQNQQASCFKKLMSQKLFATLDLRRNQILMDQNIERFQLINDETQSNLDCVYVNNSKKNITVLFFNPNAGIYEHTILNNDWFQFYRSIGYNIIFWNYCGFGNSTGKPNLKNFVMDGIFITKYFKNKKNIKILGAHGQSLGGMVASEVAYKQQLQFLIVDRSFSSLGQVAAVRFGSIPRFLYNCLCSWDRPNYLSFYNFIGPKLIIQSANDDIIPYTSQLQVSMVRCHYSQKFKHTITDSLFNLESKQYMNFFFNQICSQQDVNKLCQSVNWINSLYRNLKLQQNQQQNKGKNYINLIDENDVESLQLAFEELQIIFSYLNYQDFCFFNVMSYVANEEKVALFFGSCFSYGQLDDSNEFIDSYEQFQIKITSFLSQEREFKSYNQLKEQLNLIQKLVKQIVEKFQELNQQNEYSLEMTGYTNEFDTSKRTRLGELVVVKTTHNNNLTQKEKMMVYQFLNKQNFQ